MPGQCWELGFQMLEQEFTDKQGEEARMTHTVMDYSWNISTNSCLFNISTDDSIKKQHKEDIYTQRHTHVYFLILAIWDYLEAMMFQ